MDPALIAQLIVAATNLAGQIIPILSTNDAAAVADAVAKLNAQVDQLHAGAASAAD